MVEYLEMYTLFLSGPPRLKSMRTALEPACMHVCLCYCMYTCPCVLHTCVMQYSECMYVCMYVCFCVYQRQSEASFTSRFVTYVRDTVFNVCMYVCMYVHVCA